MNNGSDTFECSYCHKTFVRETNFMQHRCKQMDRAEEVRTPMGQAAYSFYSKWMKAYKRTVPDVAAFLISKYYMSFIRFAKYVKSVKIADVDDFINLMKDRDISPTIWTNEQAYSIYLEYMDKTVPPSKQAEITINTMFKIADSADVDIKEVFTTLHPSDVLQLIRERRFSPWVLLHSKEFEKMMLKCSKEQRKLFGDLMRPNYWRMKFSQKPETVELMRRYNKELGI